MQLLTSWLHCEQLAPLSTNSCSQARQADGEHSRQLAVRIEHFLQVLVAESRK